MCVVKYDQCALLPNISQIPSILLTMTFTHAKENAVELVVWFLQLENPYLQGKTNINYRDFFWGGKGGSSKNPCSINIICVVFFL